MSLKGNILNIQHFSVHDGPGIRTTVFMQGCSLTCWWCHNPESRPFAALDESDSSKIQTLDKESLMNEILKDQTFFDESGGGVSFSGGEPLAQSGFLKQVLQNCHENGIHTVVDTSAYVSRKIILDVLPFTDLFLFDLKLMDPLQHIKFTGVSNTEILENLQLILSKKAKVWIRIPIIPGITDTKTNLEEIVSFLIKYEFQDQINLLPYHKIAEAKYARLNIPNLMNGTKIPDTEQMKRIASYFVNFGFNVKIGG